MEQTDSESNPNQGPASIIESQVIKRILQSIGIQNVTSLGRDKINWSQKFFTAKVQAAHSRYSTMASARSSSIDLGLAFLLNKTY